MNANIKTNPYFVETNDKQLVLKGDIQDNHLSPVFYSVI